MCSSQFDKTAKWWSPSVMIAEKTGNEKAKGMILDPLNGLGTGYGYRDRAEYKQSWKDYYAQQANATSATGGGLTGETLRATKRNPGGGYTLLGG